jgi:transposase
MSGLSYPAVRKVLDLFEQGGWSAIKPADRGRTKGDARLLTPEQEAHIQKTICDKRPEQLKMDFFLWSRAAVMQLIEQECGLKLGVRTVGKYLARWGFTPQKPIKRAYEQRPEAVKAWLDEHYPAIEAKAKAEGGEIHWGDETALVNTDVRGRSSAKLFWRQASNTVTATALDRFRLRWPGHHGQAQAARAARSRATRGAGRASRRQTPASRRGKSRCRAPRRLGAMRGQGKHARGVGLGVRSKAVQSADGAARGRTRGNPARRGASAGLPSKSPAARSGAACSRCWPPGGSRCRCWAGFRVRPGRYGTWAVLSFGHSGVAQRRRKQISVAVLCAPNTRARDTVRSTCLAQARAAACSVAPVVITSSTSTRAAPAARRRATAPRPNAPCRLRRRCARQAALGLGVAQAQQQCGVCLGGPPGGGPAAAPG